MKPIEFKEQNIVFAKDQPEYLPLPAFTDKERTISLWQLSWRERIVLFFTGRVWLSQMNFGAALQPQLLQLEYPFVPVEVDPSRGGTTGPACARCGKAMKFSGNDGSAITGWYCNNGHELVVKLPNEAE